MNGTILLRNTSQNGEKLKEVMGESYGRILFVILRFEGDKYKVTTARDATQIETIDDLESLPEDEWVEVPEGMHTKFGYKIERKNNILTIVLPEDIAKKMGKRLFVSFDEGKVVISEIEG